jgi:signal transduction histidine kinase
VPDAVATIESMTRTACDIAHDFGNLVTVIRGSADLVLSQIGVDHPAVNDIVRLVDASEEAADLTKELRSLVCLDGNSLNSPWP